MRSVSTSVLLCLLARQKKKCVASNLLSTHPDNEGGRGSPLRAAGSFYGFRELECELGIQKLLNVFNLEFSIPIR